MNDPWAGLWTAVAEQMAKHVSEGRGHLLTEDVLRFTTALELERRGVEPSRLMPEYVAPRIGGKIDLVIDDPPSVAIEFKYPRDSRAGAQPDTMTTGELLKDFYRLALLDVSMSWIVQLVGDRLRRHLSSRPEHKWIWEPQVSMEFDPMRLSQLPDTARRMFPAWANDLSFSATCVESFTFSGWTLAAYRVNPLASQS